MIIIGLMLIAVANHWKSQHGAPQPEIGTLTKPN
jgi:hypothetical protein